MVEREMLLGGCCIVLELLLTAGVLGGVIGYG